MKPEYIRELADMVDDEKLWELPGRLQLKLDDAKRAKLNAGVALRRYSRIVEMMESLRGTEQGILMTTVGVHNNQGYRFRRVQPGECPGTFVEIVKP